MSAVCCPSCGEEVFPTRYPTETERSEARRRTWRESKRRQRVSGSLRERETDSPAHACMPDAGDPQADVELGSSRSLSGALTELHQYWLDRYSLDEIHELAAGLLPLDEA